MKVRIFVNDIPLEKYTQEEREIISDKIVEVGIKAIGWEKVGTKNIFKKNTTYEEKNEE